MDEEQQFREISEVLLHGALGGAVRHAYLVEVVHPWRTRARSAGREDLVEALDDSLARARATTTRDSEVLALEWLNSEHASEVRSELRRWTQDPDLVEELLRSVARAESAEIRRTRHRRSARGLAEYLWMTRGAADLVTELEFAHLTSFAEEGEVGR